MTTAPPRPSLPRDRTCGADDRAILARHWYPVARASEIGDAPTAVRLLDETLVAHRAGGSVVVAHDGCPHRGVPLSLGAGDGTFDTGQPVQAVYDFDRTVFEEDRAVVEVRKPENLPLGPRLEVRIPADRSSIAHPRGRRDPGLSHFLTA
ncbi:Rieske 2Fe-2S domain-containing protein [Streptomyces sp. QTS52]